MAALDFQVYEQEKQRSAPEVRHKVYLYRRVYNIPRGDPSIIPGKGDTITLNGVTGTGIETVRVLEVGQFENTKDDRWRIEITFYQIRLRV